MNGVKITEIIMLVYRHKNLKIKLENINIFKNIITLFEKGIPPPPKK